MRSHLSSTSLSIHIPRRASCPSSTAGAPSDGPEMVTLLATSSVLVTSYVPAASSMMTASDNTSAICNCVKVLTLIVGDAGVLVTYSLTLSTMRAFALAGAEAFSQGFDLMADIRGLDLSTTLRFVQIEQASAVALTLAWVVGGSLAGAFDEAWSSYEHADAPLGVARLLRGWMYAVPIALIAKSLAVAAVILPAGGWVRPDVPTAIADLGGMLAAPALWRTWLLRNLL